MYEYKFSDEQTEKINKKTAVLDSFKQIDKKYSFNNDELKLERKTFTAPSTEEIQSIAEDSLKEYKLSGIDKIKTDYASKISDLNQKETQNQQNLTSQKSQLKGVYEGLKQDASNDSIKQGLARSSIIVNVLDAFDKEMLDTYSKLDSEYNSQFKKLQEEKSLLESQKKNALDAFDISYASKLNDKIEEINASIEKKQKEVEDYNKAIEKQEKQFKETQEKENQELMDFINLYGKETLDRVKQQEKYNIAYAYFMNMDKNEALAELLNNSVYKDELGKFYSSLEKEIRNR